MLGGVNIRLKISAQNFMGRAVGARVRVYVCFKGIVQEKKKKFCHFYLHASPSCDFGRFIRNIELLLWCYLRQVFLSLTKTNAKTIKSFC